MPAGSLLLLSRWRDLSVNRRGHGKDWRWNCGEFLEREGGECLDGFMDRQGSQPDPRPHTQALWPKDQGLCSGDSAPISLVY